MNVFVFCLQSLSQDVVHYRDGHAGEPASEAADWTTESGGDWGGCDNILILDLMMCDLTLLSILQEPNRTHMEFTLTLRDEV